MDEIYAIFVVSIYVTQMKFKESSKFALFLNFFFKLLIIVIYNIFM